MTLRRLGEAASTANGVVTLALSILTILIAGTVWVARVDAAQADLTRRVGVLEKMSPTIMRIDANVQILMSAHHLKGE